MYLAKKEEKMLNGERGSATAKAMEILVALGEIYGAEKMIPVKSVQIAGVSPKTIGEAGMDFLEGFAKGGARARVPAYLNPAGIDLRDWAVLGVRKSFFEKQARVIRAYKKMKVNISCTCTPYLIGVRPKFGEHIAWSESSAVSFANSVLGARTNRESAVSALASAVCGITPYYGLHIEENRVASLLVKADAKLRDVSDFGALGIHVGKIAGGRAVAFEGMRADEDGLKSLGAAMAASGAVALYFVKGITPEWKVAEDAERISVGGKELEEVKKRMTTGKTPDIVAVGCPHCSLSEIREIAEIVRGKKLKRALWVCTSRAVKEKAGKAGYAKIIEKAGGRIVCDTCMVVSPIEELGYKTTAVNSGKAAAYLPEFCKQKVVFASLGDVIR